MDCPRLNMRTFYFNIIIRSHAISSKKGLKYSSWFLAAANINLKNSNFNINFK